MSKKRTGGIIADSVNESINILCECGIYIDKAESFKDVLEKIYEVW